MFKFKRLLAMLLVMALVVGISGFAFARGGTRIRISNPVQVPTDAVLPAGTWVYGIVIYADDTTNVSMGIFDSATAVAQGAVDINDLVADVGEPTQYETTTIWFPHPLYFEDGVSVKMATGIGYIYYGAEPTN